MKKWVLGACLLVLLPTASTAQDVSQAELSVGYSLLRLSSVRTTTHGWDVSIAPTINPNLALVVDFSGHYGSFDESDVFGNFRADVQTHSVLFGPRVMESVGMWKPWAHVLVGYHRTSLDFTDQFLDFPADINADTRTGFAMTVGGGLDLTVSPSIAIRLFQAEYAVNHWQDVSSRVEGARIGAGIVFRLGSK